MKRILSVVLCLSQLLPMASAGSVGDTDRLIDAGDRAVRAQKFGYAEEFYGDAFHAAATQADKMKVLGKLRNLYKLTGWRPIDKEILQAVSTKGESTKQVEKPSSGAYPIVGGEVAEYLINLTKREYLKSVREKGSNAGMLISDLQDYSGTVFRVNATELSVSASGKTSVLHHSGSTYKANISLLARYRLVSGGIELISITPFLEIGK